MRGAMPLAAERRLHEIASGGAPFNAAGSLRALALGDASGLQPLGPVIGVSTGFDVTGGASGYVKPGEFREYRHHQGDWTAVLQTAVARLRAQAAALGASVVVGVTVSREPLELHDDVRLIKYELTGTAMRSGAGPASREPVLTNLSAADHWALLSAGSHPVGLCITSGAFVGAMTRATVRIARSGGHPRLRRSFGRRVAPSQPLADLSAAVTDVRGRMVRELERQGRAFGAAGIVNLGLELEINRPQPASRLLSSYTSRYWLKCHAVATAVAPHARHALAPRPVVSMEAIRP